MAGAVLKFLKTEAGGGMLLALAAVGAIVVANSPWSAAYFDALKTPLALDLGVWRTEATLKDWVKDGLMAVFFYVIGLELKRELTIGELSNPKIVLLPVAAAIGGALAPILIYIGLAGSVDPRGWPVPVATDIAFALAALAILAPKADPRLRLFLLTLAVVDDLMAIVLIAILFTGELSFAPLIAALILLGATSWFGRTRALPIWLYPLVALIGWGLAKESGVHTSVMAVAAALIVPPHRAGGESTLLGRLEHAIHPISAFVVLPIFAFCAAGVSFAGLDGAAALSGVSAAVAIALAFGKPVGVTLLTLAAARLARVAAPFSLRQLIGVGCLCGIGFTMSLFIGALAFDGDDAGETQARLGVLMGSAVSLLLAASVFRLWPEARGRDQD
ncbi:MAG: Na+/H+ antiporter NhaA [Alphaproteobacteria bacterium]|nr:Na+/H+ antiporter NhaA [Alphaproteobacteria bacterium]